MNRVFCPQSLESFTGWAPLLHSQQWCFVSSSRLQALAHKQPSLFIPRAILHMRDRSQDECLLPRCAQFNHILEIEKMEEQWSSEGKTVIVKSHLYFYLQHLAEKSFWRPGVPDHSTRAFSVCGRPAPCFEDSRLLAVSSHGWRYEAALWGLLEKGTPLTDEGATLLM